MTVYNTDNSTVLYTFENVKLKSTVSESMIPVAGLTIPEGEKLLGWTLENGKPFSFDTQITRDYSLYPVVSNSDRFTVTYDANGGTGTVTDSKYYANGA